ncbi:hypothetical protein ABI59_09180 [Acidobacteria bacterium Mor1]|nr:hypothetical protein ABI59_09180 [Acidobacteria bacterium Mor1]
MMAWDAGKNVRSAPEVLRHFLDSGPIRMLFDQSPIFAYLKDTENRHIRVNQAVADSLAAEIDQVNGAPCAYWYPEHADAYFEDDLEVIRTGRPKTGILEPHRRHDVMGWIETDKHPIFNDHGEVAGVLVLARDVSEREYYRDLLQRTSRVKALEKMAAGVGHDLNNLLSVIQGELELRVHDKKQLSTVYDAVGRAAKLTRQLMGPVRSSREPLTTARVDRVVEEVRRLVRSSIPQQVVVRTESIGYPEARCRPLELAEALTNLFVNAWDAMPDGGSLTIITEKTRGPRGEPVAAIRVIDTGTGIARAHHEAIFAPLFTTKGGDGTGLGLSIARSLIRDMGGELVVESREGFGSEFRVLLPLADGPAQGSGI